MSQQRTLNISISSSMAPSVSTARPAQHVHMHRSEALLASLLLLLRPSVLQIELYGHP